MPWEPKRDRPFTPPEKDAHLLPKGEAVLKQLLKLWERYWSRADPRTKSDAIGRYAYFGNIEGTLWRFFFIAREKPFGDLVSAGFEVLQDASREMVPLLMYLDSTGKVYIVRPSEVIGHPRTKVSHREGWPYYDFDIRLARPFKDFLRLIFGPPLDELPS